MLQGSGVSSSRCLCSGIYHSMDSGCIRSSEDISKSRKVYGDSGSNSSRVATFLGKSARGKQCNVIAVMTSVCWWVKDFAVWGSIFVNTLNFSIL